MKVKLIYLGRSFDGQRAFSSFQTNDEKKDKLLFSKVRARRIGFAYEAEKTKDGYSMKRHPESSEEAVLSEKEIESLEADEMAAEGRLRNFKANQTFERTTRMRQLIELLDEVTRHMGSSQIRYLAEFLTQKIQHDRLLRTMNKIEKAKIRRIRRRK